MLIFPHGLQRFAFTVASGLRHTDKAKINESIDLRLDVMLFGGGLRREGMKYSIQAMSEIKIAAYNRATLD
jgi:hypothetical protein